MTKEQIAKLTNVLIFKDGYYYITIYVYPGELGENDDSDDGNEIPIGYSIVPKEWNLHDGFEFASDAYAYLVHLQTKEVEKV